MTEQELRAKSDQEINLLAGQITGMPIAEYKNGYYLADSYPAIGNRREVLYIVNSKYGANETWNPLGDANQAIQVAEQARQLNIARYCWVMESPFGDKEHTTHDNEWTAAFDIDKSMESILVDDPSFAKALTLASILAYDSIKGGEK